MNIQGVNNLISLVAEVATEDYDSTYIEPIIKKYNLDRKVEDINIDMIMSYGYTRKEAINILNGKNADGSKFVQLPF